MRRSIGAQVASVQFAIDHIDAFKKSCRASELEAHEDSLREAIKTLAFVELHRDAIRSAIGPTRLSGEAI